MSVSAFARDRMKEEKEAAAKEPQMGQTHPERGAHSWKRQLGK